VDVGLSILILLERRNVGAHCFEITGAQLMGAREVTLILILLKCVKDVRYWRRSRLDRFDVAGGRILHNALAHFFLPGLRRGVNCHGPLHYVDEVGLVLAEVARIYRV
jgi:hypothetical protein